MKKKTCKMLMLALLVGVITASAVLVIRMSQFVEIAYARSAEYELSDELYCDNLELLAICVQAEAGNQSLLGRRLVADVILNRVDDEDWPDTIEGVITQPYQFSSYWDGGMERVREPDELTIRAVQMELKQRSYPGVRYFRTGTYSCYGTPWRKVGDHYFSTK